MREKTSFFRTVLFILFFMMFTVYGTHTVSAFRQDLQSPAISDPENAGEIPEENRFAEQVHLTFSSEQLPGEQFSPLQARTEKWFYRFCSDARLLVKADKHVSQLYFQFETPSKWTLTLPDGTVKHGGENGFIHEYVDLGQSVSDFTVDVAQGTAFTGLFGFTEGETPDWVQKWLPPCDTADLLVLPTHADDEFLWFGGVLPYYAGELGYDVQVVYMTNHFNDSIREHERLNGLWTVGVRNYPIVCESFTDTFETKKYEWAVERFGYQEVLAFQVETLRRFQPKVVVAHDVKGEYGHGAHILNAETILEALRMTYDPAAFPESAEKYGLFSVQKCYLHLWNENRIIVRWEDMKLSKFNNKTALRMAEEGFARHATQTPFYSVYAMGLFDCRLFGLAYTTVGPDTPDRNDMFEHVDRSVRTRVYPSSQDEEKAVSESDIPPAVTESDEDSEKASGFPALPAVLYAGGAVLLIIGAGFIWLFFRKRSKVTDN